MIILLLSLIFQLKTNGKIENIVPCYGITKDPVENEYLLVFRYTENGDLHNNLSKNFKEITWYVKIKSLYDISTG